MKIVVVGGSGLIGTKLVTMLARDGHEVVAASRRSGVDAVTGEGLAEAVRGASVVVDVSNSPSFEDAEVMKFFTTSTNNLLACEAAAGVGHHVALSVVGTERLRSGYLRAKCAQEKLIKDSSVSYSIVQATQCFEFLSSIADAATYGGIIRVPPVLMQSIAADDVARAVSKIATGTPLNGTVEVGGPELFYLDELIRRVLGARNDPREVIVDPHVHYFGTELNERSLVPGDEADLGEIRFDDWLDRSAHLIPDPNLQPAVVADARSERAPLKENEFRISEVPPGSVLLMGDVAVFSIEGGFCATQTWCTHRQGPLSEGTLDGTTVTCPLHGAQFNVWTGAVLWGPAKDPLKTYRVTVEGEVGRVEVPHVDAVQSE